MATAKQQARKEIQADLERQLELAKSNVRQNLYEFKKLRDKQEVLKRKVAACHELVVASRLLWA